MSIGKKVKKPEQKNMPGKGSKPLAPEVRTIQGQKAQNKNGQRKKVRKRKEKESIIVLQNMQ